MFAKGVPWWCGVDVADENGLVRRGMIRGKAANGFIVDFDYPDHTRDFVPVERCTNHHAQAYAVGDTVEALYRSAPTEAWRWYPATLLAGSVDRFAFVGIKTGEAVLEKGVPVDAVRILDAMVLSGIQILRRYFEYGFEVPSTGDLGKLASGLIDKLAGERFLKVWNRETSTIGMKLEGGRLFYSSQSGRPLTAEDTEKVLVRMAKRYLSSEAISSVVVTGGTDIDQFDLMDDLITAQLSLDVMDEIFSFLTPIQQVACRTVCQLWNSVLTSVSSACRVEIDISTVGYRQLATILHETVTESTKVLILSGGSSIQQSPTIERLHTVKTMLKAMHLNIQFIVVSSARVQAEELVDSWYSDDCDGMYDPKWRAVCGTLILNNVAVWLPFANKIPLLVRKEVLNVSADVGVQGVLEKWCPEVSGPEVDVLAGKLHRFWGRNSRDDRFHLWMDGKQLLTKYQPADERFHPYDLGNFPPAGTLGVPALASLRKLTVWALTGNKRITG